MMSTMLYAADGGGAPAQPSPFMSLMPFFLILIVFYFLLIMPMRKKQKKQAQTLDALKAGDRVITTGGIYGTIVAVTDQVVQLKIASNVKIDIAKSGIAGLSAGPAESE